MLNAEERVNGKYVNRNWITFNAINCIVHLSQCWYALRICWKMDRSLTLFFSVALLQYAPPTSTSKSKYYTTDERKSREWRLRRQNVRARFLSQLMHKFIQIKMLYLIYFCLAVCRCIFYFVCWLVVIRLCELEFVFFFLFFGRSKDYLTFVCVCAHFFFFRCFCY